MRQSSMLATLALLTAACLGPAAQSGNETQGAGGSGPGFGAASGKVEPIDAPDAKPSSAVQTTDPAVSSTCGDTCMGGLLNNPCCTTEADVRDGAAVDVGKCGQDLTQFGGPACVEQDQPGELDPSCPDEWVMGMTLKGCCTPAGLCGLNFDLIMLGCTTMNSQGIACGGGADAGSL